MKPANFRPSACQLYIFALFYLFRLYRHQQSNVLYTGVQSYYIKPLNVQYVASASQGYPKVAHREQ